MQTIKIKLTFTEQTSEENRMPKSFFYHKNGLQTRGVKLQVIVHEPNQNIFVVIYSLP